MQYGVVRVVVVTGHMVGTAHSMYMVTTATAYVIIPAAAAAAAAVTDAAAVATGGVAGAGVGPRSGNRVGGTCAATENDGTDHVHDHLAA